MFEEYSISLHQCQMGVSRNPVHLQGKEEFVCSLAFPEGKLVSLSQTAFDAVV